MVLPQTKYLSRFCYLFFSFVLHYTGGCALAVVSNNLFTHWPLVNQWPIQPKQLLVTTAKTHSSLKL